MTHTHLIDCSTWPVKWSVSMQSKITRQRGKRSRWMTHKCRWELVFPSHWQRHAASEFPPMKGPTNVVLLMCLTSSLSVSMWTLHYTARLNKNLSTYLNNHFPGEPRLADPFSVFFFICSRSKPLWTSATHFYELDILLLPSQQSQITERNSFLKLWSDPDYYFCPPVDIWENRCWSFYTGFSGTSTLRNYTGNL